MQYSFKSCVAENDHDREAGKGAGQAAVHPQKAAAARRQKVSLRCHLLPCMSIVLVHCVLCVVCCVLCVVCCVLCVVCCVLCVVCCVLCVVGCGLWVVGCGLWVVGCGLWVVGCACACALCIVHCALCIVHVYMPANSSYINVLSVPKKQPGKEKRASAIHTHMLTIGTAAANSSIYV